MLTPEKIAQFNKITGGNVPVSGNPAVKSRADEIRDLAKASAPAQKEPGYLSRVISDISQSGKEFGEAVERGAVSMSGVAEKSKTPVERALAIPKGVAESALGSTAAATRAIFSPLTEAIAPIISPIVAKATESPEAQATLKQIDEWTQKHPDAARNLKDLIDVGSAVIGAKGVTKVKPIAEKVASSAATTAKDLAIKTGEKVATRTAKSADDRIWNMIQPELTPTERAAAVTSGKIKTSGVLKTVKQTPSLREAEMIKVAKPVISKAKNEIEAVADMKNAIAKSADELKSGLSESNAIWNTNEFKNIVSKVQKPISLTQPDLPVANNIKKAVLKLSNEAKKTPDGILDMRKAFDDLVENQFGQTAFAKNNPVGIYIRDMRRAINGFAESKLPEGKLPSGKLFKDSLREQSLLYDAIDNTASKVPKLGSNTITQWIKANPKKASLVKWALVGLGAEKVAKGVGVPLP